LIFISRIDRISKTARRPAEIYTDPEVVASTRKLLAAPGAVPPPAQPARDELEAALGIG
jgi:hypothetical protein